MEGNIQKYRMAFDANISLHELSDSYFVPLKTVVQANIPTGLGGVRTRMSSACHLCSILILVDAQPTCR